MKQRFQLSSWLVPACLLLSHCSADAGGGARIQTHLAALAVTPTVTGASGEKFRGGAATAAGLESLKYYITGISICETLQTSGSGFSNPQGCVSLYNRDIGALGYDLGGDWTPLGDIARGSDVGWVDLMSPSSRQQLAASTVLDHSAVRSYNYGLINWALPVKVKAEISMSHGGSLYTHDGVSTSEIAGVDNLRQYYTAVSKSMDVGPAEEAVVLLPNGGNWFKFQSPFVISAADIDSRREFVLDLVFDPNGIIRGYDENAASGQLSQRDASGAIYGVDIKALLNASSTYTPPELSKVSFLKREDDGTLTFSSFRNKPTMTGMRRVTGDSGSTHLSLACGTFADPEASGTAAFVFQTCPSPVIDVELALTGRAPVEGSIATAVGGGADSGGIPESQGDAGAP